MAAKRNNKGQFQKGSSGNPGGLTKQHFEIRAYAAGFTQECIDRLMEIVRNGKDRDSVAAAKEVLDRGNGKVATEIKQTMTVTSEQIAPQIIVQPVSIDDDESA